MQVINDVNPIQEMNHLVAHLDGEPGNVIIDVEPEERGHPRSLICAESVSTSLKKKCAEVWPTTSFELITILDLHGVKIHGNICDRSYVYVRRNMVNIRVPQEAPDSSNPFSLTFKFAYDQKSNFEDVRNLVVEMLSNHSIPVEPGTIKLAVNDKIYDKKSYHRDNWLVAAKRS